MDPGTRYNRKECMCMEIKKMNILVQLMTVTLLLEDTRTIGMYMDRSSSELRISVRIKLYDIDSLSS